MSAGRVALDPGSAAPPYRQIREQIAAMVRTGVLEAGVRLPTIRQLANDLGLSRTTVARAYRELESAGVVITRVGSGTTVARPPRLRAVEVDERAGLAARGYLAAVQALGLSTEDAITILHRAAVSGPGPEPGSALG